LGIEIENSHKYNSILMKRILIIGGGIAGLTCAHLLTHHGWEVEIWDKLSNSSPTLIINDVTRYLLQDIWQLETDFWYDFHLLTSRRVAWEKDTEVVTIVEDSLVVKGNSLIEKLKLHLLNQKQIYINETPPNLDSICHEDYAWIIDASGRNSTTALSFGKGRRSQFGQRCILSQTVTLTSANHHNACWMETISDGWIFFAPIDNQQALIQCMVPNIIKEPLPILTNLLEETDFIKTFIDKITTHPTIFAAYPQLLTPLCGNGWIAVGDAALSFDPISGDGTGYALRTAILATSVINSINNSNLNIKECLNHYNLRLNRTFFQHLEQCIKYYSSIFNSPEWKIEIELMKSSLENHKDIQLIFDEFAYNLQDFQLVPKK
jgi:flavin-dependent dehydrogenase